LSRSEEGVNIWRNSCLSHPDWFGGVCIV